jgi:LPS O-antigen subunit length determinant protein (WzzB/FepE family)
MSKSATSPVKRWIKRRLITAAVFALVGALVKRMTSTSRGNL